VTLHCNVNQEAAALGWRYVKTVRWISYSSW